MPRGKSKSTGNVKFEYKEAHNIFGLRL